MKVRDYSYRYLYSLIKRDSFENQELNRHFFSSTADDRVTIAFSFDTRLSPNCTAFSTVVRTVRRVDFRGKGFHRVISRWTRLKLFESFYLQFQPPMLLRDEKERIFLSFLFFSFFREHVLTDLMSSIFPRKW